MKPLEPKTYQTLLKALEKHDHPLAPLIELIAKSGMRSEELLRFSAEHVDDRAGFLFIKAAKGSNDRRVPIAKKYAKELKSKVLPSMHGPSLKRALRRAWESIRLDTLGHGFGDVTLHSLRASYAIAVYGHTVDVLLVQELLGHRNINSTMYYVKLHRATAARGDVLKAITGRKAS